MLLGKKKLRRRKKLSSAASPPDPLTDSRGDPGYEVTVKVSPDSSVKDLDSKIFPGENKLEKAETTFHHRLIYQSTQRISWIVKTLFAGKSIFQLTQQRFCIPRSTKRAKISGNCYLIRLINRTPRNIWVLKRLSRKGNKLE